MTQNEYNELAPGTLLVSHTGKGVYRRGARELTGKVFFVKLWDTAANRPSPMMALKNLRVQ